VENETRDNIISISDKNIYLHGQIKPSPGLLKVFELKPTYLNDLLQLLYNDFLMYLNNNSYVLTHKDREYSFTIKTKSSNEMVCFRTVVDLFEDLLTLMSNNKNIFKSDIPITYEIYYGNTTKSTTNDFIFVFSYTFQQYYKHFKETFNLYEVKDNLGDFKSTFEKYISISNVLNRQFDTSYKFYDLNDFNFDTYNLTNLSMSKNIMNIRKYIVDSVRDLNLENIDRTNYIELLNEITQLNLSHEEIKELESVDSELINLNKDIHISKAFKYFLAQVYTYIKNNEDKLDHIDNLKIIFSLLYSIYNIHYTSNEKNVEFSKTIILHNNLEAFVYLMDILTLFNLIDEKDTKLRSFLSEIKIAFKNYCSRMLSQVFSNFIAGLSEELSTIENFNDIRYERQSKKVEKMLKNCNELLIKFFDYFKEYANEKDCIFYLNYTLSLFFDVLNKKILNVTDYSNLKHIEKIFGNYSNDLKRSFEGIFEHRHKLRAQYINLLENNIKYKKYEEIFVILNASRLDKISKFLQASNYHINLDSNELISLICAIFSESTDREKLIDNIKNSLVN
jgi:hypothetical protein